MDDPGPHGEPDPPIYVPPVAIELAIRRAWGWNPSEPELSRSPRLVDIIDRQPYEPFIEILRSRFPSFDDRTDWNYEYSWTFRFEDSDARVELRLSALGPFAVLARLSGSTSDAGVRSIIYSSVHPNPQSEIEREIAELTHRAGFRLLDADELARPVALDLKKFEPNIEDYANSYRDGWVSTYQALFEVLFDRMS